MADRTFIETPTRAVESRGDRVLLEVATGDVRLHVWFDRDEARDFGKAFAHAATEAEKAIPARPSRPRQRKARR